jgi:hypothetical protein
MYNRVTVLYEGKVAADLSTKGPDDGGDGQVHGPRRRSAEFQNAPRPVARQAARAATSHPSAAQGERECQWMHDLRINVHNELDISTYSCGFD